MKYFFSIIVLLFFSACSGGQKTAEKKYVIGFSTFNYADQWVSYLSDAVVEAAKKHPGIEIVVADAKNDAGVQLSQVESFVTRNVDGVIILQVDQAAFGQSAKAAKAANIPVVAVNRLPAEEDFVNMDYFIGIIEKEAGKIQAEKFIEELTAENRLTEPMEVGILMGTLGLANQIERTAGVKEVLAAYPNIRITREQGADFDRAKAVPIVENWMQADRGRNIKAIFANNDEMAIGAILSLKAAGRTDIKVYGIDAISAGANLIGDGLNATVEQDPVAMGTRAMEIMYQVVSGTTVTGTDGKFVWIPLNRIDTSNKEEYLQKIAARDAK
ncbi:MAG: substrate-binding domain-containing protein [Brevinema sp.]